MQRSKILIISNPEDEHVSEVYNKLIQLDSEPVLFFPEVLGQSVQLSMDFLNDKRTNSQSLLFGTTELKLESIFSVWYRRPRLVALNEYNLTADGLEFARDEWRAALEGMYALLLQRLWVSHPDSLRKAAKKPLQLLLAQQLGFTIPRTLITNNPDEARKFIDNCYGKVIVKAGGNGWVYSQNEADVTFVLTNRLNSADLDHLHEIKCAPVVFQEEIAKAYEVRANIVGQKVLSIRIDSQSSEISQVDWRRYDVTNTPYTPYQLPFLVEQNCLKLAKLLDLEFGAIDLICKPNGEYVFLEINGNGQFLWAEKLSGVEISYALALLLAGISPSLQSANFI